jgi:hypothetical protein
MYASDPRTALQTDNGLVALTERRGPANRVRLRPGPDQASAVNLQHLTRGRGGVSPVLWVDRSCRGARSLRPGESNIAQQQVGRPRPSA